MTTTLRIDDELKQNCEAVFDDLGISMSGAITLFLRQVVKQRGIPFAITCNRVACGAPAPVSAVDSGTMAMRAMERFRAGRAAKGEREWSMDEIDAEIAAARRERRERLGADA